MKKFTLLFLMCFIVLNATNISAQTNRGAGNVRVKTDAGQTREVKLYDASYALVIGASGYNNGWQKLPGVKDDLAAVKEALTNQGFTVEELADPTSENFLPIITRFVNKYGLQSNNRILIYFAGHGYTETSDDGRKFGYIVPVDAPDPAKDLTGFQQQTVTMDDIESVARKIRSKHALFVFDSCFSGTLLNPRRGSIPPVITMKATLPVRQFITAGAADQEVPDVSIFRQQFVEGINGEADRNTDSYITASELADFLQEKVTNYTHGSQTPQYGKIFDSVLDKGDFIFVVNQIKSAEVQQKPAPTAENVARSNGEQLFWQETEKKNTIVAYESYLTEYNRGEFAPLARLRISDLKSKTEETKSNFNVSLADWETQRNKAMEKRLSKVGEEARVTIPDELANDSPKQSAKLLEMSKNGYQQQMDFIDLAVSRANGALVELPQATENYYLDLQAINSTSESFLSGPFRSFTFQTGAKAVSSNTKGYEILQNLAGNFDGVKYDMNRPVDRVQMRRHLFRMLSPQAKSVLEKLGSSYKQKFNRPLKIVALVKTIEFYVEKNKDRNSYSYDKNSYEYETRPESLPPHTSGSAFDIATSHLTADEQNFIMVLLKELENKGLLDASFEAEAGYLKTYHVFVYPDGKAPK